MGGSQRVGNGEPSGEKWGGDVPYGLECGLRNYWYPLALSSEVVADKPFPVKALDEDLVFWRDSSGSPHLFIDFCPHRAVKLSVGNILGDRLQCIYHGLEFDGSGRCVYIPWEGDDPDKCGVVHAPSYPTTEVGGVIWGYLGDVEKFPPPPVEEVIPFEFLHEEFDCHIWRQDIWPINWLLVWDGSFDPQHNSFIHATGVTIKRFGGRQGGIYRMSARSVPNGVKLQRLGADGEVERDLDGGWMLPCMGTLVVLYTEGSPVVGRTYRYPVDASHTQFIAAWSRLVPTLEERKKWKHMLHTRILQDSEKINVEDKGMLVTQRGLVHARANEQLLNCDAGIARVRRLMRDTLLANQEGRRLYPTLSSPLLYEPWVGFSEEARKKFEASVAGAS